MRVVRTPEGSITLDLKGKVSGRGAYVCRKEDCLKRAVKSRALERALNTSVPEELYESLKAELEAENE